MFPKIKPAPQSKNNPFWSVMIPTYNSSTYLEETLFSILEQDPGKEKMQIEIIDDCSKTNGALDTIHRLGLQDRVQYYQQTKNVGLAGNWNTCIEHARGEIVHILHQDDYIMPDFYAEMEKAFLQENSIGAAFCRCKVKNESFQTTEESVLLQPNPGIPSNFLELITTKNRILTPSIVVRRNVYENLGGYYPGLYFALDWEMWIRIANTYPVWYIPKSLATYRSHSQSETVNLGKSAQTVQDIRNSFTIRSSYLPKDFNKRTEKTARQNYAKFAFRHASNQLDGHHWKSGFVFITEGLKCSKDLIIFYEMIKMLSSFVLKRVWWRFTKHVKSMQ